MGACPIDVNDELGVVLIVARSVEYCDDVHIISHHRLEIVKTRRS